MGLLRVVSSLEVFLLLKGPFVFWPLFSPHQSRALDGLSSDEVLTARKLAADLGALIT